HVAATYTSDTGLLQLYTNGVWAASTTNASDSTPLVGQTVRQTTLPLVFGGPTWDNKWGQGFIDEVRIWAMARTAQEIQATEFCRLTGLEANLAGYWNFDEGSANDLTGHGHNGIFVGNAHAVSIVGNDAVHAGVCGLPRTATASAVLTNAFVVSANITDGGYGYTNMPTVRIIGGGGSGAVAVAVVSNGVVVAVNILDAGSGYTNTPVIVIAPPFIPQPTMGIAVHLFGPMVTPVVQLDLASLSPYDNYQLELSSVAGGIWTNVGLPFIPTGSTSTQYFNGSGNVGFFRVKHLP
ncbi:MAG: hypothetical protein NT154_15160, partial [Verrucomicrobia bacterium]|nr:hypothetical protein [Verrucomicrobiota bacterium]